MVVVTPPAVVGDNQSWSPAVKADVSMPDRMPAMTAVPLLLLAMEAAMTANVPEDVLSALAWAFATVGLLPEAPLT